MPKKSTKDKPETPAQPDNETTMSPFAMELGDGTILASGARVVSVDDGLVNMVIDTSVPLHIASVLQAQNSAISDAPLSEPLNTPENAPAPQYSPNLQALIDSAIVTVGNGLIIWREGHLENLRRLYADNPAQTERDYADDLAVAREYDVL